MRLKDVGKFGFWILALTFLGCQSDSGLDESQRHQFIKFYGVEAEGYDMKFTDNGEYVMVGNTNVGSSQDVYVVYADEYGNIKWTQTYDAKNFGADDNANAVVIRPDGGYGIVGTVIESDTLEADNPDDPGKPFFVRRSYLLSLNYLGGIEYEQLYGEPIDTTSGPPQEPRFDERGNGIIVSSNNEYILACHQTDRDLDQEKGIARKINVGSGTEIGRFDASQLAGGNLIDLAFTNVIQIPSSGDQFYFLGATRQVGSGTGQVSSALIEVPAFGEKIDPPNEEGLLAVHGTLDNDAGVGIDQNAAGNIVCVGFSGETNENAGMFYELGSPISNAPVNFSVAIGSGSLNTELYDIESLDDGYIVCGKTIDGAKEDQMYLAKLDASGQVLWEQTFGGTGNDVARAVAQTNDGGFALFGSSRDERGKSVMTLIKTNSKGEIK